MNGGAETVLACDDGVNLASDSTAVALPTVTGLAGLATVCTAMGGPALGGACNTDVGPTTSTESTSEAEPLATTPR